MCGIILRQDVVTNMAISQLAKVLYDFGGKGSQATLHEACEFFYNLKGALAKVNKLEDLPAWAREGRLACDRFELHLHVAGRSYLKDLVSKEGIDGAAAAVEKLEIKPSPCFEKMLEVVRQGPSIKTLNLDEPLPGDIGGVTKQIKNMLTMSTLPIEDVKCFFPELDKNIQQYNEKVLKNMDHVLEKVEACVRLGKAKVDKYRRPSKMRDCVCVFFLFFFSALKANRKVSERALPGPRSVNFTGLFPLIHAALFFSRNFAVHPTDC